MLRSRIPTLPIVSLTLALGVLASPSAVAQDATIEEVVVTARKVEEKLSEAPVTVSAFTDSAIESLDLNSIADIARFTPGLSFSNAFGRATERPVVRGQGNILAGVQFGVESGVAYFVDGMYYAGDISSLDLSSLERVEVIKGPQSALYGRNTYSGAINFITKPPGEEVEARLRVRGLEDGEREFVGHIGGQLIDGVLAARASVRHYEFDGQWTNLVTDSDVGQEESTSINLTLDWSPNDQLNIAIRGQYQEDDDGTRPFFLQSATENNCHPGYRSLGNMPRVASDNPNQYYCGEIKAGPIQLNDGPDADGVPNVLPGIGPDSICSNLACLPFLPPLNPLYSLDQGVAFSGVKRELTVFSVSAQYEFDSGHSITFQTSHRWEDRTTGSDSDHGPTNWFSPGASEAFFSISGINEYDEQSYELRLDSPIDAPVRWSLGGFYYDLDNDATDILPGGMTSPDGTDNFVTNLAAFASLGWDVTEQLTTTLELRYADEEKEQEDYDSGGSLEFAGEESFTSLAPRLTADYRINDSAMLFAIYSEGIKPGGLNGFDGASTGRPTYEEEESKNFEVGVKAVMMDGRLQANASLFFSDISKYQLTQPVADPTGALNSIVTNQADGEVMGVELDLLAQLSPNVRLGFNYALADSKFTEGCDEFQWTLTSGGGRFTGNAANSLNPNGMGDCSVKGHQFPMGSKHQASAYLDWSQPLAGNGFPKGLELFGNINLSYESKRYTQLHQESYTGAATLLGARLGVRGEQWSLALVGRNLTDEDSAILATRWLQSPLINRFNTRSTAPAGADSGMPRAFFALPRRERQVGIELSVNI